MHHHHLTPLWTVVFTAAAVVTFTPWGRLRSALRRLRGLRRSPVPRHGPAAKAMRSQPIVISDDDAERAWRELAEQLQDIGEPGDGGDR
jgi:hypothetical protein